MYKPTTYLTIEVDPAHATPEGVAMLQRVFNFIDPLTCEPAEELGLTIRLKCRNRPYWIAGDEAQDAMWDEVVGLYLKNKLAIVQNVLEECNVEKYEHYAGGLHLDWLKLRMEPYEIRLRLDHDAEGTGYLPDAFSLLCGVRDAVGRLSAEAATGEDASDVVSAGEDATGERTIVYVPRLAEIEERKALRRDEQARWEAWQTWQNEQADQDELDEQAASLGEEAEFLDEVDSDSSDEEALGVATEEQAPERPVLTPGLTYQTAEFVAPDGTSRVYNLEEGRWIS